MAEEVVQAGINYWARHKHWRHVQQEAKQGLKKLGNEPSLHFWVAFGMLMEGRPAEAMRELKPLEDSSDVGLACSLALINAHKQAETVDKDAVALLEANTKAAVKSCGEAALYQAGLFLWHSGKHDKAREIVDKLLKMNGESAQGKALRGWVDLTCGRDGHVKKSIKYFDEAWKLVDGDEAVRKCPDALFGRVLYWQQVKGDYARSMELINQAVVHLPSTFLPARIEQAKANLALCDWDQALDATQKCLDIDAACIEALRIRVLHMLARSGKGSEAARKIGELIAAIDQTEPRSHHLYYESSVTPTRLSGGHPLIMQQCRALLDRATNLEANNATYMTELGYHKLLAQQNQPAIKAYKSAMALDQTSVDALNGTILCQLLDGQLEDAESQLEFLDEIQASIGKTAELAYLKALLASKKNESIDKIVALLDEAVNTHLGSLGSQNWSENYYRGLQPDFVLRIARLYMQYCPTDAPEKGEAAPPILAKTARVLEAVTKAAPGLLEGVFLLGKVQYLSGNTEAAHSGAQYCLKQDSTYGNAHLLMAQIHLSQGNVTAASQSLEVGLSYNFEVRNSPVYHLIQAKIQQAEGKVSESVKTLIGAMKLPGVRKAVQQVQGAKKSKTKPISLGDRVSVYIELAKAHWLLKRQHEATKVMQDAINEFRDTPEEVRVQIANADLAVARGDVEGALNMLRSISTEQSYYVQSREKMAQIYLVHRKDKRLYAACYKELVDQNPTSHTCLLLGDAYMNIQQPQKAIEIYEKALKEDPTDSVLASKIGSALTKTHDYKKAINYYEAAVNGNQPQMRADLAALYIKLGKYPNCEKILTAALDHEPSEELAVMQADVRYHTLYAKMHTANNQPMKAILVLVKARDAQARVLNRVATEQPEALKQQQQLAADICFQMAEYHSSVSKELSKATMYYQEALSHDETSAKAMVALAQLHLANGDLESAQFQLTQLLRHDKHNNDATVMMADLMFRKNEYDSATFHFQQLLEREPRHYEALARLVDLLRRAGRLESCPRFLTLAEKAADDPDIEPGLNYCRGVYSRYVNEPNNALKHLNLARRDTEWGVKAMFHMVEVCLNPDNQTVGGETLAASSSDDKAMAASIDTAQELLDEIATRSPREQSLLRFRVLRQYSVMATKNKGQIEKALTEFRALAGDEREAVAPLLGMARAHMLLKQTPKARNQLKAATKFNWNVDEAADFEGAWLLLADIHISNGKMDLAEALLKKALQRNKSCSKAWEYMGVIKEKEQSYVNAADHYEYAWSFCNESIPAVGYKLAFNYLKAERYVDAIDVCHVVLKKFPDYPKIRKDILDKARSGLRM